MAKILDENITITLSTILRDNDNDPHEMISDDQLETLQAAVEGLLEDATILVEVSR